MQERDLANVTGITTLTWTSSNPFRVRAHLERPDLRNRPDIAAFLANK